MKNPRTNQLGYTFNEVFQHINNELKASYEKLYGKSPRQKGESFQHQGNTRRI